MHYHLEIIIPPMPLEDIPERIAAIMAPFSEHQDEEDRSNKPFWDFFVIGGRFAGNKLIASLGDTVKLFEEWMTAEKVMVKGFTAGKEELADEGTREKVDAKWSELFPAHAGPCPLFKHSNDQYGKDLSGTIKMDICKLSEVPATVKSNRVIIAHESEASFMVEDECWNGVTHIRTVWDGTVAGAVSMQSERFKHRSADYLDKALPGPDWLCVTVDYHA